MNFARIIRLFIKPQEYWNEVVAEPGDIKSLLLPQMLILAAIPAISNALGTLFAFMSFSFVRGLIAAVIVAILTYIFAIAIWILFGVFINIFAGVFRGNKDFEQSMKLATGAAISVYAGSVLSIIPGFSMHYLGLFAGYGYAVFLLIKGFPIMNGVSGGKAVGYAFAVVGIMFAIAWIMLVFSGCTMGCVAFGSRF